MKDKFDFEDIFEEDIGDELIDDECFEESPSIAKGVKLHISVDQEVHRLSIAYFKVYDHERVPSSKRVARLHFKDSGMEYHANDPLGKEIWAIPTDAIKNVIAILKSQNMINREYSNWQVACFEWNHYNGLLPGDVDLEKFFTGAYDQMHRSSTRANAFVPSTQKMPDTWIYDPPKGKGM